MRTRALASQGLIRMLRWSSARTLPGGYLCTALQSTALLATFGTSCTEGSERCFTRFASVCCALVCIRILTGVTVGRQCLGGSRVRKKRAAALDLLVLAAGHGLVHGHAMCADWGANSARPMDFSHLWRLHKPCKDRDTTSQQHMQQAGLLTPWEQGNFPERKDEEAASEWQAAAGGILAMCIVATTP